jgi:beta-phosphoglucomutase-like phosphatase (HAD superfamily)
VVPEETYAIEDSYNGIRSASRAGMKPIMVPDMLPPTPEMESLSLVILPDLLEALAWLKERKE